MRLAHPRQERSRLRDCESVMKIGILLLGPKDNV
jgi:hypothetical protein